MTEPHVRMLEAFFEATGLARRDPIWSKAHRWRYALAENPLQEGCLFDSASRIAVCGDWTQGNRVEGALLAGLAAARRIAGALAPV
jgi:predicted NAD/FAD-dependent oxidoreductase